jgi:hypothetical protein
MKRLLSLVLLILQPPITVHVQKSYSTSFSATENPISEGGHWINGRATGVDWCNMQTGVRGGVHYAFGVITPSPQCSTTAYNDPIAVLTGTWATTQHAIATVYVDPGGPGPANTYPEVEVHTNVTISAHNITGYEFDCGENPVGSLNGFSVGFAIVRWNGPLANSSNSNNGFTYLANSGPTVFGCANGDVIEGHNTGAANNNLQFWKNGLLVLQATDHTYTAGSPGIGVNATENTSNVLSGLSSFSATDAPIASH